MRVGEAIFVLIGNINKVSNQTLIMVSIPDKKEYLCERCGRTIKHRGKCLPCNVYLKNGRKLTGYREAIQPKEEVIIQHTIKDKIYSRLLATEYKYATICLFSLFIISILFMMVAPEIIAVPLLFLIVGSLLISITFFKNYVLWSNGATGEERVINELKKLGKDFLVINDLKLPNYKGNIDHLVLSKNGIFIIETKNHKANIKCNGDYWEQEKVGLFKIFQKQLDSPSKQVKESVVRLKEFLNQNINFTEKLWFDTIVVFSNKDVNLKEITNPTVTVLKLGELENHIKTHKNVNLSQNEINALINCFNKIQTEEQDDANVFKNLLNEIKTQIKFPDYWKFVKFGLIFGLFWLLFDEIFYYNFNEHFNYDIQSLIYLPFTGGLIPFLLGKFFLDVMNIKLQSRLANLMLISLIGWLPFLLEFWIFIGFSDYIPTSFVYILARFALVIPVMFVFHVLKWRI